MTALPKRRISTHRRGKRQHGQARVKNLLPALVKCPHCGQLKPPHQTCPHCGFYKGELIVENPRLSAHGGKAKSKEKKKPKK